MGVAFDTVATVRELDAAEPVTRPELDAVLAKFEIRLIRWVLAIGVAIVAAVKLIPGL